MAGQCGICQEVRDQVLSLPCHAQHRACRECLEQQTIQLGHAIKCHECRQVFGMVNFNLLHAQGETIPEGQRCFSCLEGGRDAGEAVQYCVECKRRLCGGCFKSHEQVFCGNSSHKTIAFDEYRKKSDKLSLWTCDRHSAEVLLVCSKCKALGCVKCQVLSLDCPRGGKHPYVALETNAESAAGTLSVKADAAKAARMGREDELKLLLDDMETYRVNIEGRRGNLKQQYEQQATQLKQEYETVDAELEQSLQDKKTEVEGRREALTNQEARLQELQDGLEAILSSYHPARLVTSEEEILAQIQLDNNEQRIDFTPPELVKTGVEPENLLGMRLKMTIPDTGHVEEDSLKEPSNIKHVEIIQAPGGQSCLTVCYPPADEQLIHAGRCYNSLEELDTGKSAVDCVEMGEDGNIMMLLRDNSTRKCAIVTYRRVTSNQANNRNLYQKVHQVQVHYITGWRTSFIRTGDFIYQPVGNHNKIYIFNQAGRQTGVLTHPDIAEPEGICANESDVFVGCRNSIMTFSIDNPEKTLRRFAICNGLILGIAYHHQHIYAISQTGSNITVFNLKGNRGAVGILMAWSHKPFGVRYRRRFVPQTREQLISTTSVKWPHWSRKRFLIIQLLLLALHVCILETWTHI